MFKIYIKTSLIKDFCNKNIQIPIYSNTTDIAINIFDIIYIIF